MPRLRMLLLLSCVALLGAALTHAQCVFFDCDAAVGESTTITCESLETTFGMDCTGCNCSTIVDAEHSCVSFYVPASLFAAATIALALLACMCDCREEARCMSMQFGKESPTPACMQFSVVIVTAVLFCSILCVCVRVCALFAVCT